MQELGTGSFESYRLHSIEQVGLPSQAHAVGARPVPNIL